MREVDHFINGGYAALTQQAGGLIDPSNTVSLTGGSLTLVANNTLAGLVFDNYGSQATPPTVTTGGTLTPATSPRRA